MGRRNKNLSKQEVREITDLYTWGMKIDAIAQEYRIDRSTPGKVSRKNGVRRRRNGRPDDPRISS